MRKYAEFVKEAGPYPKLINGEYLGWAYKQRECKIYILRECKAFPNIIEAQEFSKLVDKVWENEDLCQASMDAINEHSQKIYDAWYAELRNSKSSIPDNVFDMFFKKANWVVNEADYVGDSNDTVAEFVEELVEFFNYCMG
jgi:hypothetical protein